MCRDLLHGLRRLDGKQGSILAAISRFIMLCDGRSFSKEMSSKLPFTHTLKQYLRDRNDQGRSPLTSRGHYFSLRTVGSRINVNTTEIRRSPNPLILYIWFKSKYNTCTDDHMMKLAQIILKPLTATRPPAHQPPLEAAHCPDDATASGHAAQRPT